MKATLVVAALVAEVQLNTNAANQNIQFFPLEFEETFPPTRNLQEFNFPS